MLQVRKIFFLTIQYKNRLLHNTRLPNIVLYLDVNYLGFYRSGSASRMILFLVQCRSGQRDLFRIHDTNIATQSPNSERDSLMPCAVKSSLKGIDRSVETAYLIVV